VGVSISQIRTALPHETLWNLTTSAVVARSLQVIEELGVADLIEDSPVSIDPLASRCGADPDALERVLRLLVAHEVFQLTPTGYTHSEASRLLRRDHPMSMGSFVRMMGLPALWSSFGALERAVRTGAPAIEVVEPDGFFAYLQARPDEAQIFGKAMTDKARADIHSLLHAYDFSPFRSIADIGGGQGHLLTAVLEAVPTARGILFDLPNVVNSLGTHSERLTPVAGDFFVNDLPHAELYLLMEVLHDWPDAESTAILRAIRRAASAGATVLLIEDVLPDESVDARARVLDVIMLAITGGRERTPSQFSMLLESAGFRVSGVIDTSGPMRIVEAIAV
jgi:O-methyltransferase domain